jgi:hypothetical protein
LIYWIMSDWHRVYGLNTQPDVQALNKYVKPDFDLKITKAISPWRLTMQKRMLWTHKLWKI